MFAAARCFWGPNQAAAGSLIKLLGVCFAVKVPHAFGGDDGPLEKGSSAEVAVTTAQFCQIDASRHPHRPTAMQ